MEEVAVKETLNEKRDSLSTGTVFAYGGYVKRKKLFVNRRNVFNYKGVHLYFTQKQINVLRLIAKGFSNSKIAKSLGMRDSAVKLLVYRLMKYLEGVLYENVDRFYLVIIAQQLGFTDGPCA